MNVSIDLVRECLKAAAGETPEGFWKDYAPYLPGFLQKGAINTAERLAMFFAQVGHESGGFRYRIENLNYSADGLKASGFKKYFKEEEFKDFHRKPEKIANRVYANRMQNGTEDSGDGWRYRGRGLIQITGKANYTALSEYLGLPLEAVPAYLETNEGAVASAVWFWTANKLNTLVPDLKACTKRINGGYNGLDHRTALYTILLPITTKYQVQWLAKLSTKLTIPK